MQRVRNDFKQLKVLRDQMPKRVLLEGRDGVGPLKARGVPCVTMRMFESYSLTPRLSGWTVSLYTHPSAVAAVSVARGPAFQTRWKYRRSRNRSTSSAVLYCDISCCGHLWRYLTGLNSDMARRACYQYSRLSDPLGNDLRAQESHLPMKLKGMPR